MLNPVRRVSAFPAAEMSKAFCAVVVIVVFPVPSSVIAFVFEIKTVVVYWHVPPGTSTVSPELAALMAACTAVAEHDAAVIVAACSDAAANQKSIKVLTNKRRRIIGPPWWRWDATAQPVNRKLYDGIILARQQDYRRGN